MARDISELGADVFDDSPKKQYKISPKKRNYIIGLSITGALLIGALTGVIIASKTVLTDYANVDNVMYYFTPDSILKEGEKPTAVLYRLPTDKKFPSTFYIPSQIKGYTVVGVADEAFASHEEIKKVIMPNSLQWVGQQAFANCTNLASFSWSKNLTDVGVDAFINTKFYNNLLKDTTTLYDLPSGILIYAGNDYFQPNTALVSDSLTEAEISVIKGNYSVSNVKKFSELNVKSICSGAFKGNDKITYIDLPESLDDIYISTFEGCSNLEAIDGTHSQLISIGKRAFANCTKLKDISVPSALETLGDEAFANTAIKYDIPDLAHVKNIGEGLFANCTKLESVTYKANIVYNRMFSGCENLTTLHWGDASDSNINNVTEIGQRAFAGTGFTSFLIPKNVVQINDSTFEECENLTTVSMFENIRDELLPFDIDDEDEEERISRDPEAELPYVNHSGQPTEALMGVQSVYESAFQGCTSLSTINLYDFDDDNNMVIHGEDGEFTFPYSLNRCDGSHTGSSTQYTFAETCPTKVIFSPNMKNIGAYAFNDCASLTEVVIDQFEKSKLLTIKASAFEGCSNLVTMPLPTTLLRIESGAFAGCEKLANISIADLTISAINVKEFYDCQALTSLVLPETITSIKSYAFYRNYNLNHIIVPEAIREILDYSFTECRLAEGETMDVFIERTYSSATQGSKRINFGKKWHDDTVVDSFLLETDGVKKPCVSYWNGDAESPVVYKLLSLAKTGTLAKTEFKEGDSFNSTGLVFTASYDDGTDLEFARSDSSNFEYIIWNKLKAGDTSVTGTYTVGAVSLSITVTGITVTAK